MPAGVEADIATDANRGGSFSERGDIVESRAEVVLGSDDPDLVLHHCSQVFVQFEGVFSGFAMERSEHALDLLFDILLIDISELVPPGRVAGRVFSGPFPEDDEVRERVASEPIRSVHSTGDFASGKQSGHSSFLAIGIDSHSAHRVVAGWSDFHGIGGDVDVGEFLELVIHRWQFSLDRFGAAFRGDIEVDTTVGCPASGLDFTPDGSGDDVAGEQFGRSSCIGSFVGDDCFDPSCGFFFGLGIVPLEHLGDVVEHEPLAFTVSQHASFAADPFGDQCPLDAGRPDHPGGVELNEFAIDQFGTGPQCQCVSVGGVFPAIGRDVPAASDAAGGQHDRFAAKDDKPTTFSPVPHGSGNVSVVVGKNMADGGFHEDVDTGVNSLVLKRADHFQAGSVTDMSQPGIGVSAEVALVDAAGPSPVEHGSPFLQFANPFRSFLGMQLGHAILVQVLAALERVVEVSFPAVAIVGTGQRRCDSAFGHHRVRLAQQRFADQGRAGTGR